MKSDADIINASPRLAREISGYSPAFRSSLAESYCNMLAYSKFSQLTPRELEAYANVVGKKGFTIADVMVLRFAIDRVPPTFSVRKDGVIQSIE